MPTTSISALTAPRADLDALATVDWRSITDRKRGLYRNIFGRNEAYLLSIFRTGGTEASWWHWEVKRQSDCGKLIAEGSFKRQRDAKIAAVRAVVEYEEQRQRPTRHG